MFSRMMPLSYNCLNWRKRFCVKLILWLRNLKFIYAVKEWLLCKEDLARFKSADAKLLALQHRKTALDMSPNPRHFSVFA